MSGDDAMMVGHAILFNFFLLFVCHLIAEPQTTWFYSTKIRFQQEIPNLQNKSHVFKDNDSFSRFYINRPSPLIDTITKRIFKNITNFPQALFITFP